ncbi:MAG: tripartite tricarboxylate transporter TctB family protein [Burkholderiaceae bacterium]|nr:tripartite tricarboxylate transporter TctB family protein [Burkholderiaceae bacterium]
MSLRGKFNSDTWGGLAFLTLALVFGWQSLGLSYTSPAGPGPRFFPIWLSGALACLSLLYIRGSLTGEERSAETARPPRPVLAVSAWMLLFIVALPHAGFVLTTTAFLFLLLSRGYRWKVSLPLAIAMALLLFWLFRFALRIQLPVNSLGF